MTTGDLSGDTPPGSWAGPRKDLYLPYLFMRANAGDTGTRPVVGAFWESPDIMVLAGVEPSMAPPVPAQLGQTAQAGAPNTLYAHVWNFGQSAAPQTVVEFYWCDPTLGIGPQSAHLVGQTIVALGARGQRPCARGGDVPGGVDADVPQRRARVPRRPRVGLHQRRARDAAVGRVAEPARRAAQHPRRPAPTC